jgi:hypothetical protein
VIGLTPPAALPRVRADSRGRFLGQFECSKRITRRQRELLTDALKTGLVSPEDLAERLGIAPCTSESWTGAILPVEVRPDPARRAFLESRGLRLQPLTVAEVIFQERGLLVSHSALLLALRSNAAPGLVPVLVHRVRAALPGLRIENIHGVGFRFRGELPWELNRPHPETQEGES